MSTHKSNYGSFGGSLPTDLHGYTHTTIRDWMRAPMDWGFDSSYADRLNFSRELAAKSRDAIRAADSELAEWRNN